MKNIRSLLSALVGALVIVSNPHSSFAAGYADGVVNYNPGTGYATEFGTGIGYTDPLVALGAPQTTTPFGDVTPFNPPYSRLDLVSIGAGGSLTLQFNTPILNDPLHLFGLDFIIYGSAGFIDVDYPNGRTDATAGMFGANPGVTRVSVSSGDGIFHILNPLLAPTVDNLFPTDGAGIPGVPVNPTLTGGDFANRSLAEIRSFYGGGAGGTAYDIAWAVDGNGQSVSLSRISQVRIDVVSGRAEIDALAVVVPEPSTWGLIGMGVLMFGLKLRRRATAPDSTHS